MRDRLRVGKAARSILPQRKNDRVEHRAKEPMNLFHRQNSMVSEKGKTSKAYRLIRARIWKSIPLPFGEPSLKHIDIRIGVCWRELPRVRGMRRD
jgi:hypothetical protein